MKVIKLQKPLFENGVKFASLNKNETLDEYKNEVYVERKFSTHKVGVEKIFFVDRKEWSQITNQFMTNWDQWEKIGGSNVPDDISSKHGFDKLENIWDMNDEQRKVWDRESYSCAVKVINHVTGECIWVNTEGYSYARYVGIA
ncbi:MAG: hypothetical protein GY820_38675 [Gammaproteobacteria bacterium]|nr:hypothetical protein [Gammaproteobacteria bacterium]